MLDMKDIPMKVTDQEKGLLGLFRRLESKKSQDDLIFQAEAMVRAQDALRADYGLTGQDAALSDGSRAAPDPAA
jgi:hypothetical protein